MSRNLDRRVEIMFPVEDARLKAEVGHILDVQLADNVKAQLMQPGGSYVRVSELAKTKKDAKAEKESAKIEAQMVFCKEAQEKAKAVMAGKDVHSSRVFTPMMHE